MIGALAGAFVLLLLSAFTSVLGVGGGPLGRAREAINAAYESNAGDCLNWSKDLSDAQKVECGKEHKFEVTGTASDTGGGVVAGVEVSIDGGRTWHPAEGTTKWRYTWSATAPPAAGTIRSRAVDDSGNLEAAGARSR